MSLVRSSSAHEVKRGKIEEMNEFVDSTINSKNKIKEYHHDKLNGYYSYYLNYT
jgi:hypothetical protein